MCPKYGIIDRELNLKELKMQKVIEYFIITATMENGDKWETRRHTRDGLSAVIQSIWKDDKVASFSVVEKVAA
jgi:hypothetical protein